MAEDIDLKELEKKAFKSTLQDGLFDIYFGILLLGFGIANIVETEDLAYYYITIMIVLGIGCFVLIGGKKLITEPRMGKVKFGRKRKARKAQTSLILSANFVILLIVYLISANTDGPILPLDPLLLLLIEGLFFVALPMCLVAYMLQFPRVYIYGLLFGTLFFWVEVIGLFIERPLNLVIAFGVIGGAIIITGFIVFVQFLKKYPKPPKEVV